MALTPRSLRPAALAVLFLVPCASAQAGEEYSLAFTTPRPVVNVGDALASQIFVTRGDEPVPNAEVRIGEDRVTTNDTGRATYGLYNGDRMGSRAFEAVLERVTLSNGQVVRPNVPSRSLLIAWTQLQLSLEAPATATPPGNNATLVATVRWQHNGTPVAGVPVTFVLSSGPGRNVTDGAGAARLSVTRATPGAVWANATIATSDRPWGIRATTPLPARVAFEAPAEPPPPTPSAQGGPIPSAAQPAGVAESGSPNDPEAPLPPAARPLPTHEPPGSGTPWPGVGGVVAAILGVIVVRGARRRP